mgnify:CR=1 FL=1
MKVNFIRWPSRFAVRFAPMRALRLRALPPLLFALAVPRLAGAEDCTTTRPTDPAGVRGYAYGNVQVQSFATAHIRVWYTLEGANAVRAATTRADQVPDDVALSANVTEEAYQKYADMKFRAPVSDASHPACVTNGGDGKTDVYLLHFTAADGQTIAEQCKGTPKVCSGFILADARFDKTYKTFEEGARTVLPHELFHAVQEAYDGEMDGYWSEGTAQWAAKVVSANIQDLERFLPEFFKDPSRSLGTSPGGSAAAYLYSTAIWPVFLSSRFGNDVVREMLDYSTAVFDPAGQEWKFEGVIKDVTEQRRTIAERDEAESAYHSIFEHALEGIFHSTPEGRFLTANPALARMFGYESPAHMLREVTDSGTQLYVEPGRREDFRREIEQHGQVSGFVSEVRRYADGGRAGFHQAAGHQTGLTKRVPPIGIPQFVGFGMNVEGFFGSR